MPAFIVTTGLSENGENIRRTASKKVN